MVVLTQEGLKAEVLTTGYANGVKVYAVRTHAGTCFTVEALKVHRIEDKDFEPFQAPTVTG